MEDHAVDWNRVEGNWKEVKGKVKEKWGKLTDDDLTAINGQREQLEGRLQQRYGYAKDQTKKEKTAMINGTVSAVTDSALTSVDSKKAEHTVAVTAEGPRILTPWHLD